MKKRFTVFLSVILMMSQLLGIVSAAPLSEESIETMLLEQPLYIKCVRNYGSGEANMYVQPGIQYLGYFSGYGGRGYDFYSGFHWFDADANGNLLWN